MLESTHLFVIALLVASPGLLAGLALLIHREMIRAVDFDRRLSAPRRQAIAARLWSQRRERHRGAGRWRGLGLALVQAGSILAPVGQAEREKLMQLIRQAGYGQPEAISIFLSLKIGTALVFGTGGALWAIDAEFLAEHAYGVAVVGLVGLVVGSVIPEYVLRTLVARRTRAMSAALPDALDLMVMSLESGLTFERALAIVAQELAPIERRLAGELRMMEAELRLGADRRLVLQEFHRRAEVEGLRDLAMTLIQSERYGTPLSQSMKNIAVNERTQRSLRIDERAERLPVLLTLPMLLFVVPGTMALVAGPAFLTAVKALGALGGR